MSQCGCDLLGAKEQVTTFDGHADCYAVLHRGDAAPRGSLYYLRMSSCWLAFLDTVRTERFEQILVLRASVPTLCLA